MSTARQNAPPGWLSRRAARGGAADPAKWWAAANEWARPVPWEHAASASGFEAQPSALVSGACLRSEWQPSSQRLIDG